MELIERTGFLELLQSHFENIEEEGHCVFVSGEAGIGKTSLIKAFCKEQGNCTIYQGACDALFTPRPLAPLYDIIWQVHGDLSPQSHTIDERTQLFAGFFHELRNQKGKILIVFEDIHWADEATLDFVKFLARRISLVRCLFILTYRDNEVHSGNSLRNILGQLPPDCFTRLQLTPLSRQAVETMATEKGYNGEDVYSISGGNPFYVNEILASYSTGVPDNIKDSILSVYNRQDDKTKQAWDILSILPNGFEIKYLEKTESLYSHSIQKSLDAKILILKEGVLFFKHELYRRTIEASLSPHTRICYNKKMLDVFRESFEKDQEIERIIHHAKNANAYDIVGLYAPLAAKKAACVGAHIEACKLYLTAIENYQGNDPDVLIGFYEGYAYESYLTNNIKEAIIYTGKSLNLRKEKNDIEEIGNCLRFLSRLWWFDCNRKNAESYAEQAIEVLNNQPSSSSKAMAFSNMSQLKMHSDQAAECILWGEKAIAMAKELNDEETLCHALNNVGDVQLRIEATKEKGIMLLQKSLEIALKNSFHEHAARAYTNLGHNGLQIKDYEFARNALDTGIQYCEERDLDSFTTYMISCKAKLDLETGYWDNALRQADNLIRNENQAPVVKLGALAVLATINMRKGDEDVLPLLLEAKTIAFETIELQRIIPVLVALLEYEWITGKHIIQKDDLDRTIRMTEQMGNVYENSGFAFWLLKARKQHLPLKEVYEGYDISSRSVALKAAELWKKLGCPYEQALCLYEGGDDEKRKAITIIHELGANTIYKKMKLEMSTSGIKSIPRGIRKSTQSNSALLTSRELDVLQLLKEGLQNKEIAGKLFISAKTVDHHISSILFKLSVNSRTKAVNEAVRLGILK
jgi:DNA-binding CsgD family transcriptional regulator/tetratricopeptide (TPR) repeat protein